ncbi:MAG: hypothetical protein EA426_02720 [Spirochaetaceae bacterium]|nr:MAG: hypothetical protein EA426_02720 [Spirochaetaceae bacterium]
MKMYPARLSLPTRSFDRDDFRRAGFFPAFKVRSDDTACDTLYTFSSAAVMSHHGAISRESRGPLSADPFPLDVAASGAGSFDAVGVDWFFPDSAINLNDHNRPKPQMIIAPVSDFVNEKMKKW